MPLTQAVSLAGSILAPLAKPIHFAAGPPIFREPKESSSYSPVIKTISLVRLSALECTRWTLTLISMVTRHPSRTLKMSATTRVIIVKSLQSTRSISTLMLLQMQFSTIVWTRSSALQASHTQTSGTAQSIRHHLILQCFTCKRHVLRVKKD